MSEFSQIGVSLQNVYNIPLSDVLPFAPDAVPAPLYQDGVASLAQVSVSCGLGDVVSHPAGRSVVNEHFFFLCEGNYSIPLAIRQ